MGRPKKVNTSKDETTNDVVLDALRLTPVEAIQKSIDTIMDAVKDLQKQLHSVMDTIDQYEKTLKLKKKRVRTKPASGFASPAPVSDEMCDLLYIPRGSLVPRTTITRLITGYIRSNNLQDPKDGRRIIPNETFKRVFRLNDDDIVTFFNIQKYLKVHCGKNIAPEKLKPI